MDRTRPRGRQAPPRPSTDTRVPVIGLAELGAYLACRAGAFGLVYLHQPACPAGHDGSGQGCRCRPDMMLHDHEGRTIAEVRP